MRQRPGLTEWNFIPSHTLKVARSLGLGLNSGHDLSLANLEYYHRCIPWLDEVSIGHALICDALYLGLKRTIEEYKRCLI